MSITGARHGSTDELLRVSGVGKSYTGRKGSIVKAVDAVSFSVTGGEVIGLLGPNGAGKTTTIKMVCGLITPDTGSVTVAGHDIRRERRAALRHISAVLEGNRNLYWRLSVRENLTYFAGNRGWSPATIRERSAVLVEQFGLADKVDQVVANLSRGMQQKLAIAVALLADTDVLLLDEPTLGLDVETGYEVRTLLADIARSGKTVVLSTHDMAVVEALCRRVVVIDKGRVVTDDEVANLKRLFRSRSFEVKLVAPLPGVMATELRTGFNVTDDSTSQAFTVELRESGDLYRLMDFLRAAGAEVESVEKADANFEHVFRSLVNGAAPSDDPRQVRVGGNHVVA